MIVLLLLIVILDLQNIQILQDQYSWISLDRYMIIKENCNIHNLDISLVCSLIQAESRGKQYAKSSANARGLMQVRYFHFPRKLKKRQHYDEQLNIKYGCKYLALCRDRAKNIDEMLKNYNSGCASKFYNWPYIKEIKSRLAK